MMNSVTMPAGFPIGYSPKVMPGYSGIRRCCLYHAMQLASIRFVRR